MNSIGWNAYITRGMPKPRHDAPRQSKKLPSACDLRFASRMAWYSAVSGASCPRPHDLLGSKDGWPATPGTTWRVHWPRQSGYLGSGYRASSAVATTPEPMISITANDI